MPDNNRCILVPDVLPNNIRPIREMKKLTVKQVADELKIDRNFLAAVEMENKNFSGKTTIRALKYYNINFYKMYDVKGIRILPVTDWYDSERLCFPLSMDIEAINNIIDQDKKVKDSISSQDKMIEYIVNSGLLRKELRTYFETNFKDRERVLLDYNINGVNIDNKTIIFNLDVNTGLVESRDFQFDINFVKQEDHRLTEILLYRGFPEEIINLEEEIDNNRFKLIDNKLILDKVYKISIGDSLDNFVVSNEIDIDSGIVEIKYVEDKNNPIAKFKVIKNEINCLKAIRTIANLSIEEMHESLGLSYNGYINLELGNQKISSKIMWRLVQKLKVPLEAIINIDEYFDRFCKHEEKIRKGKGIIVDDLE